MGGNLDAGVVLASSAASGKNRVWCRTTVNRAMTSHLGGGHVELLLGAYLMGGLAEDDAAAVRAHLDVCAMCKAEHDDLAPVTGWLSLLSEAPEPPHLTVVGDPDAERERGKRSGRARRPRGHR
jgi:hypothetical protein